MRLKGSPSSVPFMAWMVAVPIGLPYVPFTRTEAERAPEYPAAPFPASTITSARSASPIRASTFTGDRGVGFQSRSPTLAFAVACIVPRTTEAPDTAAPLPDAATFAVRESNSLPPTENRSTAK